MSLTKRYLDCFGASLIAHLVYVYLVITGTLSGDFHSTQGRLNAAISWLLSGYVLTYVTSTHSKDGDVDDSFRKHPNWTKVVDNMLSTYSVTAEEPFDEKKQYIIGCFPHGANSVQHLLTMTDCCGALSKVFRGPRRDLAASILFYIPVIRELSLLLGNVDASSATAKYNLKKGRSLLIFVGGEKEQLMAKPHKHQIFLKSRKGFVKLALQYGCELVPSYAFGETELYHISDFALGFRKWLQRNFAIGITLAKGRPVWWNWMNPLKNPLHVVFGKPIKVAKRDAQKDGEVTDEEINALHELFIKETERLFETHKAKHGLSEDAVLEVL